MRKQQRVKRVLYRSRYLPFLNFKCPYLNYKGKADCIAHILVNLPINSIKDFTSSIVNGDFESETSLASKFKTFNVTSESGNIKAKVFLLLIVGSGLRTGKLRYYLREC